MISTRWARFVRGWLVAGISVTVASFSHVAGGGMTPGIVGVVLALAFAGLVSIALAGKTLSRIRLAVSVALSQFAFHLLFVLGAGSSGASAFSTPANHHGMVMLNPVMIGDMGSSPMHAGLSMWFAHAVAAIVTVVILYWGESAFWTVVNLAHSVWATVRISPVVESHVPSRNRLRMRFALDDRRGLRDLSVALTGTPLRGPPLQGRTL